MSINLQKYLKERRQFGKNPPLKHKLGRQAFEAQVYSDRYLISQLTCDRELPGHTGCVNTLDWSLNGDKLLSGSDDKKLNIYKPFEDYEISTVINTGHRANIFSAKFMPQTSDNIIISGAGDSEVRIFDLQHTESPLLSMYVCHSDQVKKICVYDDNPNEFLTCSQDGTVRLFDLRVPHICSPHNVRSFLTAQNKPAQQFPLPEGPDIHHGCPPPIVNYSKYNIELNSMTINKIFPHYFAVAGMNDYIYLHDRRMLPAHNTQFNNNQMDTLKCVKRFSPTLDGYSRPNKHITACTFSDSNGYELIGSWSSDGIYLFNINDSPVQSSIHNSIETSTRPRRDDHDNDNGNDNGNNNGNNNENDIGNDNGNDNDSVPTTTATTIENNEENKRQSLWQAVVRHFTSHDLANAMLNVDELLRYLASIDTMDANLCKACTFFVRAAIMTCHINESYLTLYDNDEINEMIEKAESFSPNTWKGMWCKAIGYWILCGGVYSNGCNNRELYLGQSLEYARQTKDAFQNYIATRNNQPTSSTATNISTNIPISDEVCLRMIDMFLQDLETVCMRDGYMENTRNVTFDNEAELNGSEYQYKWLNFINVMHITSDILSSSGLAGSSSISNQSLSTLSPNNNNEHDVDTDLTSSSVTSSHAEEDDREVTSLQETNNEDEESLYTRVMSGQIMDIYRRGGDDESDEEDSDFDLEAMNILRDNANLSFDTDVGVVKPRLKYVGHCNIETVKDVNFYGLHDEYIVSGSDRGHLFIWDKKTTEIVQILRADEDVVNVAKGHPFLPILAVSGIDSTVKIFKPTSRLPTSSKKTDPKNPNSYSTSSRLYKEDEIVSTNRESNSSLSDDIYMTRSMYAAFLRMERQRSFFFNEDGGDDDNSSSSSSDSSSGSSSGSAN